MTATAFAVPATFPGPPARLSSTDCRLSDNTLVDYYTFNGTAGQQIYMSMTSDGRFIPQLRLRQGGIGGTVIAEDRPTSGTSAQIPRVGGYIILPTTGQYTIDAREHEPDVGYYTLVISTPTGTATATSTPNPSTTATPCAAGSLDTSFNGNGIVVTPVSGLDSRANGVAIQSDGKIVAAGYSLNGSNYEFAVVRYNTNGMLDTTFNGTGKVTTPIGGNDSAFSVAIQPDGKIVAAGYSLIGANYEFAVVRYNTNGTLDTTFNGTGKVTTPIGIEDYALSVAIQSDGKIVMAGGSFNGSDYDFAVVRYNTNGTLDTTFNGTGKVTTGIAIDDDAWAVAIQQDGKIVAVGSGIDGSRSYFALARYNTNGTLDTSFNGTGKILTPVSSFDDYGYSVAIQSDGKIVAAGDSDFNLAVVRYNTNGALDASFNGTGTVVTSIGNAANANSVAIQSDGRLVAAGYSLNDLDYDFAIVRYNTNGTLDTSFNGTGMVTTPIGFDDGSTSVAIQSDGRIVAAGVSSTEAEFNFFVLARYHGTASTCANEVIALHSGNGTVNTTDNLIKMLVGPLDSPFPAPFTTGPGGQFEQALNGLPAPIIVPNGAWVSSLGFDPAAKYISDNFNGATEGASVLYAVPFVVNSAVGAAQLDLHFVVDNRVGAAGQAGSTDPLPGIYINEQAVGCPSTGLGNILTQYAFRCDVTALVIGGGSTNTLYINSNDLGGPAGLMFSAIITVIPAPPMISGTISYGNAIGNPAPPRYVKDVSLSSTAGAPAVGPVITGTPGTYMLTGFGAGSYTIKPTKPGGPNVAITSNDAARVAQGVSGAVPFVSQNQRFAADASGNGVVTSNDAALIARFAVGLSGSGNSGQWKFFVTGAPSPLPTPPQVYDDSRAYASVTSSLTGEDYVGILVGEVSGNWNPATHLRPSDSKLSAMSSKQKGGIGGPESNIVVELPQITASTDEEIIIPVYVQGVADKGIVSYEFNLRYDTSVIMPQAVAVDLTGTASRGLSVVTNATKPGLLRVVVYGAIPMAENGVLLNLRFTAVGGFGSISPISFERIMFNEGEPVAVATDGLIAITEIIGRPN
ncbi:MAG: hypothetical protein IPL32_05795 [Chloracidobacterium sp.]|nr:hypothetical protein [Chloracidobacterium sp.]